MNIILIGMPGCGKSTMGILLAKVLCYQFIDTDLLIQEQEGTTLARIINLKGVSEFIEIENNVISSIETDKTVIATGGSAVYGQKAMIHLRKSGKIVYLRLPFTTIQERLGNFKRRGVVLKDGQTLRELYDERCSLYEKYATHIIDADGLTLEETMDLVAETIVSLS